MLVPCLFFFWIFLLCLSALSFHSTQNKVQRDNSIPTLVGHIAFALTLPANSCHHTGMECTTAARSLFSIIWKDRPHQRIQSSCRGVSTGIPLRPRFLAKDNPPVPSNADDNSVGNMEQVISCASFSTPEACSLSSMQKSHLMVCFNKRRMPWR